MQLSKRIFNFIAKQFVRKKSSLQCPQASKSTYNDLPVPSGDWQTHFKAQQRKYNTELILGVGILVGTIVAGKVTGMFYAFNDFPARPADIENYKTYNKE